MGGKMGRRNFIDSTILYSSIRILIILPIVFFAVAITCGPLKSAALAANGSISGTVTASGGGPLASVAVIATNSSGTEFTDNTDASGNFLITSLDAGCYQVQAFPSTTSSYKISVLKKINLDFDEIRTGVDFALQSGGSYLTLSGTFSSGQQGVQVNYSHRESGLRADTQTIAGGVYNFIDPLPAGEAVIWVSPGGGSGLAYESMEVNLTGPTATVDFNLGLEGRVRGRVVDADSNPLENVRVTFWNDVYEGGVATYTQSDGTFTLQNIPPDIVGAVEADPDFSSGYCQPNEHIVYLTAGQEKNIGDIRLQNCAAVAGNVVTTDTDDGILCDLEVDAEADIFEADEDVENGFYEMRLPQGPQTRYIYLDNDGEIPYKVVARPATVVVSANSVTASDMEVISEENPAAAAITGALNEAVPGNPDPVGELIVGAMIPGLLGTFNPDEVGVARYIQEFNLSGFGGYSLFPVPPGSYDIICVSKNANPQGIESITLIDKILNVDVSPGSTEVLRELLWVYSGREPISGKVRNFSGTPVIGATVIVTDSSDQFVAFARTDQNGDYTLYNLPSGTLTAQASHPNHEESNQVTVPFATPVPDLTLSPAPWTPGSITGYVYDDSGSPFPNVTVVAFDFARTQTVANTQTGPTGSYTLDVSPGSYLIVAVASTTFYALDFYDNAHSMEDATPVTVSPGASTPGINFQMEKGGWISGQVVRSSDGTPIDNASVTAYEYDTNKWASNQDTEPDGTYIMEGLMPGTYRVKVEYPDYATKYFNNTIDFDSATEVTVTVDSEETGKDFALDENFTVDGAIQYVRNQDGTDYTLIEVIIGGDFPGDPITQIASVSVSGPAGFGQVYTPAAPGNWVVSTDGKYLYLILNGTSPALGLYSFTVAGANAIAADTDYQYIVRPLPVVDPATRSPADGAQITSSTPVFKWDLVNYAAEPELPLFYRFQIREAGGPTVHDTGRIHNLKMTGVPNGRLAAGTTYEWRVRVSDSGNGFDAQNRSNSAWQTVTMANPLSHPSRPVFSPDTMNVVTWSTANGIGALAEVEIIDLDGIASDGNSHTVTVTPPGSGPVNLSLDVISSPTSAYYSVYQGGLPPAGVYVFTVTDPDGNQSTISDTLTVNPLDPFDETSISPSLINEAISASFDNVYVNGGAFDLFDTVSSIDQLNPERWSSWTSSNTSISNGAVVMSLGNSIGRAHAALDFSGPDLIDSIQADITIHDITTPDGDARGRISGYWYNNGINDVWASLSINGNRVYWGVTEDFLNEQGTWQWASLDGGELLTGLSPGDTVTVSISWNGSSLTFTADGPGGSASDSFTASGTINPPINPGKQLETRIHLVTDTTPLFSWAPVTAPDAKRYRVRIYNHDSARTIWSGLTAGDETSYRMPPGILKPNAFYRFRLDAWDGGNPGFDIDNRSKTPPDASDNYIFYTGAQEDTNPSLELSSHGVHTFNSEIEGSVLSFWVKVHDAQGVPGNIKHVKVQHPDGPEVELEAFCSNGWSPSTPTSCIYQGDTASLPIKAGTYVFTVEDNDGHFSDPVYEDFVPNAIGYPDPAGLSPANGSIIGSTAVSFDWEDVSGAAFYSIDIYDYDFNLIYQFHRPANPSGYSLPEGFLKEATLYRWRVKPRRELFSQNSGTNPSYVDNMSTSPDYSNMFTFTTTAQIDSDGDGMPDDWEITNFGDLNHSGSEDSDGDGLTDLQEYQGGSDPNLETDRPTFTHVYVGSSGDDANVGNQANPVATLHAALDIINRLDEGDYELHLAPGSGPYTFAAEGNDTPLVIEQNITINGGNNLLDGSGDHGSAENPWASGIILDTGANEVTIQDLTIQNFKAGISVRSDGGCVNFVNVTLDSCEVGLQLLESQMVDIDLEGLTISGCMAGIEITGASSGNTLRNGTLSGNSGNGIQIVASSDSPYDNLITNVQILNNGRHGIVMRDGSSNQVSDCFISGNNTTRTGYGSVAVLGGCAQIYWNVIEDNNCAGIYVEESAGSEIHGNLIHGSREGIKLSFTADTLVQNNTISDNSDGLVIEAGSSPDVLHNILWDNTAADLQTIYTHGIFSSGLETHFKSRNRSSGSWSSPTTLFVESEDVNDISLDIDNDGIWHLVYTHDLDGLKYVNSISATPAVIDANGADSVAIAVDTSGTVHVVYTQSVYNPGLQSHFIYRNNASGSWSAPATILIENDDVDDISLDIDNNGIWHLIYAHDIDGLKYFNSISTTPTVIDPDGTDFTAIAVDKHGVLHTVNTYSIYNPSVEVHFEYRNNSSGSWSSPVPIWVENEEVNDISLAIDTKGIWHLVYSQDIDGLKYLNSVTATPAVIDSDIAALAAIAVNPMRDLLVRGDYAKLEYNNIGSFNLPGLPGSNLSLDPKFVNAGSNDFHLDAASPCIDACADYITAGRDLEGQPRPLGYVWDMGAYESAAYGDTDGDGMPDWWETLYFGNTAMEPDGDEDSDGILNIDEYHAGTNPQTALTLTIDNPAEVLLYTNSATFAVSGTSQSATGMTIKLNATPVDSPASPYESWANPSPINLASGNNVITVEATDGTYTAAKSITVILDSASPQIEITAPAHEGSDPYATSFNPIVLSGSSSDDTMVETVTWRRTAGSDVITGVASGAGTWLINGIELVSGEDNLIAVTATDPFGNFATDTITIRLISEITTLEEPPAETLAQTPVDPLDLDGDNYMNDDETACGGNPDDNGIRPPNLKTSSYPTDPLDPYFQPDKVKRNTSGAIIGVYLAPDCRNPDDDQDGMPDTWENTYGLNPQDDTDWDDDPDGDGDDNLTEYRNGTDPTRGPLAELQVTVLDSADQPVYNSWLPKFRASQSDNLKVRVEWIGDGAPATMLFALTNTSRYPGRAENDPDPAETITTYPAWYDYNGFDFGLTTNPADHSYNQGPVEVTGSGGIYTIYLHCWDFGGRTRLVVTHPTDPNTQVQIWIPKGSGSTGISSNWQYDNGTQRLNPNTDVDAVKFDNPSQFTAPPGDDFLNIQEYRGITYSLDAGTTVSHMRLNPYHKDFFLRTTGFTAPYPFTIGNALANAEIDVHDTTAWGHDATEDKSFFIYYRAGGISDINQRVVAGTGLGWLTKWPAYELEFKLDEDPGDMPPTPPETNSWMPVSGWVSPDSLALTFPYNGQTGQFNPAKSYTIRRPLPPINVMIVRLEWNVPAIFSSDDGHIKFIIASPPNQQNPYGTRHWAWSTKGVGFSRNTDQAYGLAVAMKKPLDLYVTDKPYQKVSVWDEILGHWRQPGAGDNFLAPLNRCEDYLDSGDFIDGAMDEALAMMLGNTPNGIWDGDRRIEDPAGWNDPDFYSPFDIDGDGFIELPYLSDPSIADVGNKIQNKLVDGIYYHEYSLAEILQHTVSHEIIHSMAGTWHSQDPLGLMYRYSNNWSRANHLSDWYRSLLRIHNRRR